MQKIAAIVVQPATNYKGKVRLEHIGDMAKKIFSATEMSKRRENL